MQTFLLMMVLALTGVEVYRWTDADGVVHFSDRPHPGAERVTLQSAPMPGSVRPTARNSGEAPAATAGEVVTYDVVSIQSPTQDEVLWNIEGQLAVAARVEPPLRPGHQLQVLLDGQPVAILPPGATQTRLSEVFRGTHTVAVEILDRSGTSLARSQAVPFVVQQTSIANPTRAPTPTPLPGRP